MLTVGHLVSLVPAFDLNTPMEPTVNVLYTSRIDLNTSQTKQTNQLLGVHKDMQAPHLAVCEVNAWILRALYTKLIDKYLFFLLFLSALYLVLQKLPMCLKLCL